MVVVFFVALVLVLVLALGGLKWWPASLMALIVLALLDRATRRGEWLDPHPLRKGIRGERRVAETLGELGPAYQTLHDIDTGHGNIDHVVIGPTGVFAIETKEWEGRFYPRSGRLMFNDRPADQVVRQATAGALEVKRRLRSAGLDLWVQALIVSTRASVYAKPIHLRNITVIEVADLPAFIRSGRGSLDGHTVTRAVAAILQGGRTPPG